MSFTLYLIGFIILIIGVAWGLSVLGASQTFIIIACLILLGLGIVTGAARTRMKDPPAT